MTCICVLVGIVASGNGRTGLISMATRSWRATGCARWWVEMDGLADLTILSASARPMPATASTRASRWCDARAWQDGGDEILVFAPVKFVSLPTPWPYDLRPRAYAASNSP